MAFFQAHYSIIVACHVISVMAWMAGMLYLPRLVVYHADAKAGSELSETLKIMERRLLRGIMNPAMIAAWFFGVLMLATYPEIFHDGWIHVKLPCVIAMSGLHGLFSKWRKQFAADANTRTAKFYRVVNEVPAVLLIVIVVMVIVKPF